MSYKKYIIVKKVDLPEEQKYHGLSRDDEYEHLYTLDTLGIPMGEVPLTEDEKDFVESLPQVDFVDEVIEFNVPEPTQPDDVEKSGNIDLQLHNIPQVHQRTKGENAVVSVIDTGLDNDHAAKLGTGLKARIDFTGSSNGANDVQGHGTHVIGVVNQCAPAARILSAKALGDNGSGSTTGIIKAITWSIDNGAHVISLSLGAFPVTNAPNNSLSLAVNSARDKGVLVPCAAGNDQSDYPDRDCANENTPGSAAKAICVAAVNSSGQIAAFSNKGSVVDIAGAGVRVASWGLRGTFGAVMSGTSMATPHVAGGCALLRSVSSDVDKVELSLFKGSRDTSISVDREGHGIMDVLNSYNILVAQPEPTPPPTEPTPPAPEPPAPTPPPEEPAPIPPEEYEKDTPRVSPHRFYKERFLNINRRVVIFYEGVDQGVYIPKE